MRTRTQIGLRREVTLPWPRYEEQDAWATFDYTPGSPESGRWGPPENYDPGDGGEITVTAVLLNGVDILPELLKHPHGFFTAFEQDVEESSDYDEEDPRH
jgi:hypothetical protein